MKRINNRGFTLIELVIFIIVGAIFIPLTYVAFTTAMKSATTPDYMVKARFYAEQRMEMITSNAYSTAYFGRAVPTGDVSDPTSELETGFSRTWSVCYVYSNDINYDRCDITSDTNYQKITVQVIPPVGSAYIVTTIVTRRPKP